MCSVQPGIDSYVLFPRASIEFDAILNTKIYKSFVSTHNFWCFFYFIWLSMPKYLREIRMEYQYHDDVFKWKHFPRYWRFVRGTHRSPVNFPHKGQWRRALMFSLICARINGWVNNREAGDFRRHRAHYDVAVMFSISLWSNPMLIQCLWIN